MSSLFLAQGEKGCCCRRNRLGSNTTLTSFNVIGSARIVKKKKKGAMSINTWLLQTIDETFWVLSVYLKLFWCVKLLMTVLVGNVDAILPRERSQLSVDSFREMNDQKSGYYYTVQITDLMVWRYLRLRRLISLKYIFIASSTPSLMKVTSSPNINNNPGSPSLLTIFFVCVTWQVFSTTRLKKKTN